MRRPPKLARERREGHFRGVQGLWFAGLGAGAALLATLLLAKLRRWTRTRARRQRQHAAGQAEHDAQQLLADHGYRIEQVHPRQAITVQCDDDAILVNLRADLLVSKAGKRFVADVKNGAVVADLRHGPTRRQLLEYALAYPCDGVLLVDMHRRRIQRVGFDWANNMAKARVSYGPLLLVAVLLIAFAVVSYGPYAGWLHRLRHTIGHIEGGGPP